MAVPATKKIRLPLIPPGDLMKSWSITNKNNRSLNNKNKAHVTYSRGAQAPLSAFWLAYLQQGQPSSARVLQRCFAEQAASGLTEALRTDVH